VRHAPTGAREKKVFFFEKKKQKTFNLGRVTQGRRVSFLEGGFWPMW
jgi:hypothetical protein